MLCRWKKSNYSPKLLHKAAAILTAAVLAVALSAPAFAAGGQTGGLTWSLSGGTLRITGSGDMPDYTDANMPPWSDVSEKINRIVVSEGVTSVGSLAFYNCGVATSVTLPSSVASIGDRAFKLCRALTFLRFPAGLKTIGEAAFEHCESLNGIVLPNGLNAIGDYAFDRCISLSHLTIPASVTQLGRVIFHCCSKLTQVIIECPIEKLPDCSFYGCESLYSVSLPTTVTALGDDAFHDCPRLASVYYSGERSDLITAALADETTSPDATVIEAERVDSSNGNIYISSNSGTNTAVSNSENASITKTLVSSYNYTINGEEASLDEVLSAGETDVITAVESSEMTIDAMIHNPDGWNEVVRAVNTASGSSTSVSTITGESSPSGASDPAEMSSDMTFFITSSTIIEGSDNTKVNVRLEGSEVTSRELAKLAGKNAVLNITTENGSVWSIDESSQSRASFQQSAYDLDYQVTKLEEKENATSVKSESLYQLKFNGNTDFKATVGVPLKVGEARKTATLYQKNGKEIEIIQSVIVDDSGTAWFPLANVDSATDFYVAVNAAGVNAAEAVVPQTLAKDYGMDSTLMGMDGVQYRITGRSSRWGITGGQFAVYVAIGIGTIVLIVTLSMTTYNKLAKSKARYVSDDVDDEIDEEALRMEIMRELLEETKTNERLIGTEGEWNDVGDSSG